MNSYYIALQNWTAFFPNKHTLESQHEMFPGEFQIHLMALLALVCFGSLRHTMLQPILNLTAKIFSFITLTLFLQSRSTRNGKSKRNWNTWAGGEENTLFVLYEIQLIPNWDFTKN